MSEARSSLLLVRHGKAEDAGVLGDEARALTADGRTAFRLHARSLVPRVALDGILTSPLVRAVQTAEILAEAFGISQVLVKGELDCNVASARGIETLARAAGPGWALVGHNPSMTEALARMLGLDAEPSLRKGGVVAMTLPTAGKSAWHLEWAAAPGRGFKNILD